MVRGRIKSDDKKLRKGLGDSGSQSGESLDAKHLKSDEEKQEKHNGLDFHGYLILQDLPEVLELIVR